jgi:hypothetical protein
MKRIFIIYLFCVIKVDTLSYELGLNLEYFDCEIALLFLDAGSSRD